ncbi:serine protease inhibitor, putative [Ichthyophthirius multifiliis]|uniref:Serine protease inhibitor, putative n=1 Tax=Ichthyophthirius multifiliis TaxID=5932 RepID=G0QR77_ICHMU|nr:serine protease inhibitor, putative [Ichthyophthirius multifiliis]EGR32275.1 serine protease inhibitor, putative [Ichthyophthirius multifiliis]|eukprot:XP_004035761.1 serine protease inhibitor, putative [Ichthyophthirius multifiliis]
MVLVNAIYFKGEWASKFENKKTVKEVFHFENNGGQVQVDMMKAKNKINYGENSHFQYIQLPYKGNQYAMYIILSVNMTLQRFEQNHLNQNILNEVQTNLDNFEVNISLPKFKVSPSESIDLSQILKDLGLVDCFSQGSADFSNMDPSNTIYISQVFHKAMIEVNEEGAEASAATSAVKNLGKNKLGFVVL